MSQAKKAKQYTAEDFKDAYGRMEELPAGKLLIGDSTDPHHRENVWVRVIMIDGKTLFIIDNTPLTPCFHYKDVVASKPGTQLGAELLYAHLRGRCVVEFVDDETDSTHAARKALFDAAAQHGCDMTFWSQGVGLVHTPTPKDTDAVVAALRAAGATRISDFAVRPGFENT